MRGQDIHPRRPQMARYMTVLVGSRLLVPKPGRLAITHFRVAGYPDSGLPALARPARKIGIPVSFPRMKLFRLEELTDNELFMHFVTAERVEPKAALR
jgi:hypothetical protein